MKNYLFIVITLLSVFICKADEYEVSEVLGPPIIYNGKVLAEHDRFTSSASLNLSRDNVIDVFNLSKKRNSYTISGRDYRDRKCHNVGEYFTSSAHAVTRGDENAQIQFLRDYITPVFLWRDSITVTSLFDKNKNRRFAIDIIDGYNISHEVELPSFDNGRSFSFPKELLFPTNRIYPLVFNLKIGIFDSANETTSYETVIENIILLPRITDEN